MSFLSKLIGKEPNLEKIGYLESVCPHCEAHLDKRPNRKKKCPHCSEYIYVRTRPADQKKVLVTEEQRDAIDVQWMQFHGTYEMHEEEQREYEQARAALRKQFGHEPQDGDVRWRSLNTALMEHSGQRNWGLYRNTRLDMADQLRKEGKDKQALETYLDVSYMDTNGP
jgi:DNA-directed RNA polymerase subunit RPC12/RpoP